MSQTRRNRITRDDARFALLIGAVAAIISIISTCSTPMPSTSRVSSTHILNFPGPVAGHPMRIS